MLQWPIISLSSIITGILGVQLIGHTSEHPKLQRNKITTRGCTAAFCYFLCLKCTLDDLVPEKLGLVNVNLDEHHLITLS